jgi:hypothetical protein
MDGEKKQERGIPLVEVCLLSGPAQFISKKASKVVLFTESMKE